MNTLLIGPRGCGKTAIGRRLAAARGLVFADLDDRVLIRFPQETVSAVWSVHGEPAWRAAEVEALGEALSEDRQVLALGGGTHMIEEARRLIERERRAGRARVVYLECEIEELARRLRAAPGDRPSLTGADALEEIAAVLARRRAVYEATADVVYRVGDVDEKSVTAGLIRAVFGGEG